MSSRKDLLERLLRYVKIDTRSEEESETVPTTEKQKDLSRLLVEELKEMGVDNANMDDNGYVMAWIDENLPTDHPAHGKVPAVGLIAHVDTYPGVSGTDVKPQVHENYDGNDIKLPGDPSIVIRAEENPTLKECIGHTVITSDGTTLLGADDKAGVAVIMQTAADILGSKDYLHGKICIGFTPDEEVGRGANHFDVEKFGADFAYTVDASEPGELNDETYCADSAQITVTGVDHHPGYARNKMINAITVAGEMMEMIPRGGRPETTMGFEGYLHPISISGNVSEIKMHWLVRDFTVDGLKVREKLIEKMIDLLHEKYPHLKIDLEIKEYYRNMKYKIAEKPEVIEVAEEAIRRAGLEPHRPPIRGGTDGANLSYKGLPTPNLFSGEQNYHSKMEWVSLDIMEKSMESVRNLLSVCVERAS